ncbi:MAG TPA: hypothetical protein ENN88_02205 [Candidatus Coatesbacteria bacterium]|nr:hypothetical protein [Candidatus Coatesbacteria bacterium]
MKKTLFEKLLVIDRRWIFLCIGVVVIAALVLPIQLSIGITTPVQNFYNVIKAAPEGSVILVSMDLGPSTLPELEPMLKATVRHALDRGLKVIAMTLLVEGPSIAERIMIEVTDELNHAYEAAGEDRRLVMGEDWVYVGFRAGGAAVILQLGEEIRQAYPTDYYGVPLDNYPMMKGIRSYGDMALVVGISGTALPEAWVSYAGAPYGIPILIGVTAVSAPQYYAYTQTGQMAGLLGGLKGASEYERLINYEGTATKGMNAQQWVHIVIVVFIVIGNIAYFVTRAQKERGKSEKAKA